LDSRGKRKQAEKKKDPQRSSRAPKKGTILTCKKVIERYREKQQSCIIKREMIDGGERFGYGGKELTKTLFVIGSWGTPPSKHLLYSKERVKKEKSFPSIGFQRIQKGSNQLF